MSGNTLNGRRRPLLTVADQHRQAIPVRSDVSEALTVRADQSARYQVLERAGRHRRDVDRGQLDAVPLEHRQHRLLLDQNDSRSLEVLETDHACRHAGSQVGGIEQGHRVVHTVRARGQGRSHIDLECHDELAAVPGQVAGPIPHPWNEVRLASFHLSGLAAFDHHDGARVPGQHGRRLSVGAKEERYPTAIRGHERFEERLRVRRECRPRHSIILGRPHQQVREERPVSSTDNDDCAVEEPHDAIRDRAVGTCQIDWKCRHRPITARWGPPHGWDAVATAALRADDQRSCLVGLAIPSNTGNTVGHGKRHRFTEGSVRVDVPHGRRAHFSGCRRAAGRQPTIALTQECVDRQLRVLLACRDGDGGSIGVERQRLQRRLRCAGHVCRRFTGHSGSR